ncbi:1224_t:CDS:2, partial [Racocetra fulgida]
MVSSNAISIDDTDNTSSIDNESIDDLMSINDDAEFIKKYNDNYQLPPGFSEALRLLDIKARSNMTN